MQPDSITPGKHRRNYTRNLNAMRDGISRAIVMNTFDTTERAAEALLELVETWNGQRDDLRYRVQMVLTDVARDVRGEVTDQTRGRLAGSLDDPLSLRGLLAACSPYTPTEYRAADLMPHLLN